MTNVPPPSAPPQKKGLSTGAKVAIGCGIAILIVAIVVGGALMFGAFKAKQYVDSFEKEPVAAAGRTYAALHPEIEFVEADEDAKRVTLRNETTGETITIDVNELEQGRIRFENEEGEMTIETSEGEEGGSLTMRGPDGTATFRSGDASAADLPDWTIMYPGAKISGTFSSSSAERRAGTYTITSEDGLEEVTSYFKDELESAGYSVETQSVSGGGQELRMLQANNSDLSREMSVTISRVDDQTRAAITYEGPGE
ncbi:MAG: hypothetical protein R3338_08320 [Thermoanaerobaculia bacterium]|nr:hypothetical protein [Thermoanaerobaculia bacterium]